MKSYNLYKSKEISDTGEKEGECNMDLDIGRLVLAAAIIFLPMYFFQKLADWNTVNQKIDHPDMDEQKLMQSIADLSVAFCNIVCYIRKSYCNYRREEN